MHYIIIDLEWNQPLSHMSSAFRRVGDRLMFEMIQIGAVKLDERRRLVGSFSTLITPEFYMKLHPRIHRITGIAQEDLADAPRFINYIRATCARYRELKALLRLVERVEGLEVASGYAFGRA